MPNVFIISASRINLRDWPTLSSALADKSFLYYTNYIEVKMESSRAAVDYFHQAEALTSFVFESYFKSCI